jgi:hypothetical protein
MGVGAVAAQACVRLEFPVGPLLCVINGPTGDDHGRPPPRVPSCAAQPPPPVFAALRAHQLRHAHALEIAHEGVPLIVIQRQLGHSNLGITSIYLQGIDSAEIIEAVHARRAPMVPVGALLRL